MERQRHIVYVPAFMSMLGILCSLNKLHHKYLLANNKVFGGNLDEIVIYLCRIGGCRHVCVACSRVCRVCVSIQHRENERVLAYAAPCVETRRVENVSKSIFVFIVHHDF